MESEHLTKLLNGKALTEFSAIEQDTLSRYCQAYARWQQAESEITEHGCLVKGSSGFPSENPYIAISLKYAAVCSKMEDAVKAIIGSVKTKSTWG